MNDNIIDLLDLTDNDSEITDITIEGSLKTVTLTKKPCTKYCPVCHTRLHSKGRFTRRPNHQILQDGYTLQIIAIGRRWFCPNPNCSYSETDQFGFIQKRKKNSSIMDIMILRHLKDLSLSCVQIARMCGVSDTYVHQVLLRYVDLKRKPLTPYISIDEVYINLSSKCKYAIVIMDFVTGDILDILQSRRKEFTQSYFLSIPKEERDSVKYLISDMYNPYINYTSSYFLHAQPIVDSFHVLQWLNTLINRYINTVKKKYQERDRKILEQRNYSHNKDFQSQKESPEVYILNHARWVILQNQKHWTYHERRYNHQLDMYMDTFEWEKAFLSLDDHFSEIRTLKDLYDEFNESYINDLDNAALRLDELIGIYSASGLDIFRQFASLLKTYHDPIVASFTYLKTDSDENHGAICRRLSNGPMEAFNGKPSGLRSQSHGISNFDFFRSRILWSIRDDAPILAVPKSEPQIHSHTGRKRGTYNTGK